MDQVQTSTLLHYGFWWFNRRLMEMHTQGDFLWLSFLWPRTNDTLWVNPCSPAPGIIRNYSRLSFVETSAQKQRNRSKSTSEKSFHVCSVQYPNELVGFPTHRYYRGCPTPHRQDLTIQGSSAGNTTSIQPQSQGICKYFQEMERNKSFEFRFENLQTTTEDHKVDLPWWIASLQDNLASMHFQQFWVPFGEFKRLNSLELQAVPSDLICWNACTWSQETYCKFFHI